MFADVSVHFEEFNVMWSLIRMDLRELRPIFVAGLLSCKTMNTIAIQ